MTPWSLRKVGSLLCCAAVLPLACRHYRTVHEASGDGGAGSETAAGAAASQAAGAKSGAGGTLDGKQGGSGGVPIVGGADGSDGETGGTPTGSGGGGESEAVGGTPQGAIGGDWGNAGAGGQPSDLVVAEPDDFEGLVLWLEASTCTADEDSRAQECPDQSGNHNDASQLTASERPKLVVDGLNGRGVLTFDGGDETEFKASALIVPDAVELRMGTADFSLAVVGRWRNNPQTVDGGTTYSGYGVLFQKAEPSFPYRGIVVFANYPSGYATVPSLPRLAAQLEMTSAVVFSYSNNLNDDAYRVYTVRRSIGEKLEIRIDSTSEASAQISTEIDTSAVYQPITIGGTQGAALRGEIAEIVLIRGQTDEQDLVRLELGLKQKYGL